MPAHQDSSIQSFLPDTGVAESAHTLRQWSATLRSTRHLITRVSPSRIRLVTDAVDRPCLYAASLSVSFANPNAIRRDPSEHTEATGFSVSFRIGDDARVLFSQVALQYPAI